MSELRGIFCNVLVLFFVILGFGVWAVVVFLCVVLLGVGCLRGFIVLFCS